MRESVSPAASHGRNLQWVAPVGGGGRGGGGRHAGGKSGDGAAKLKKKFEVPPARTISSGVRRTLVFVELEKNSTSQKRRRPSN